VETLDLNFWPLSPEEIPVIKQFDLGGGNVYNVQFDYNKIGVFYTCTISSTDGTILYSSNIMYGQPVINALVEGLNYVQNMLAADPADLVTEGNLATYAVDPTTLSENGETGVLLYGV